MCTTTFTVLAVFAACLSYCTAQPSDLEVSIVPDHVRPYVVRAYTLPGVVVGTQVYRFPVTGPSSGNAFTLISTAAPASAELGVLPHVHQTHFENFYCLRGRFNLWTSRGNDTAGEGRVFSPGDYGAVPPNTTHTFQITDPFTEMVGVVSPGGFEDLFYFLGSANVSSGSFAPYIPHSNATAAAGGDPSTIASLEKFDVHARLDYVPPRAFDANGTTNSAVPWHNGANQLAEDNSTSFFVAKDFGPKFLTGSAKSGYAIIQPFVTATQSNGKFTEGTITLSKPGVSNDTALWRLPGHTALEVVDGLVSVWVEGSDHEVSLSVGDVAFVPAQTGFRFWGAAAFSKVLYVCQGNDTLDGRLRDDARVWDAPVWPA